MQHPSDPLLLHVPYQAADVFGAEEGVAQQDGFSVPLPLRRHHFVHFVHLASLLWTKWRMVRVAPWLMRVDPGTNGPHAEAELLAMDLDTGMEETGASALKRRVDEGQVELIGEILGQSRPHLNGLALT